MLSPQSTSNTCSLEVLTRVKSCSKTLHSDGQTSSNLMRLIRKLSLSTVKKKPIASGPFRATNFSMSSRMRPLQSSRFVMESCCYFIKLKMIIWFQWPLLTYTLERRLLILNLIGWLSRSNFWSNLMKKSWSNRKIRALEFITAGTKALRTLKALKRLRLSYFFTRRRNS